MYCEFYQLTERPFNVTPDPKFLYLNARYREAIASLNYGITQRKGFITLIGEAGTGKTTLLKRLLEDLDPKTKTVFIFNTNVTFEEILEYIFAEFDLPVHNGKKLYMLQRLNTFLLEELRSGGNVALLIDEAQDLEFSVLEDLRLLSNLETAKEKILQIVLSGQPELGQKLSNPILRQLRQRITINCRLLPLSRDEITEYLQYRLQAAGGPDLKLFTREAEDQIYHFSRGVPRLVNVVCDNALVIGYALGKKRIGADIIKEAAADLLPVEIHEPEPKHQSLPTASAASPLAPVENRWRARFAVLSLVLVAVVAGFLSIGRTTTESATERVAAAPRDPRFEVIQPGSRGEPADEPRRPAERPRAEVAPIVPEPELAADAPADRGERVAAPMVVRDPREEARRRREELAWHRSVADVRDEHPQLRDRPRRMDPPAAPAAEIAPVAAPAARVEPQSPVARAPEVPANEPLEDERGRNASAPPVVAPDPVAVEVPVAPAPAAEVRVEFEEIDEPIAPALEEPILAAKAALPAPAPKVEPEPRLELVPEVDTTSDPGVVILEGGNDTSEPRPRLDGVRFSRIRVQQGDSVSGIAIRRYGQASPTILDLMKLANPNVNDIDMIVVGQTIRLPQLDEAFPILNEGDGRYSLLVFSTLEGWRANGLRDELRARGFGAGVSRGSLGARKPVYRVLVAGFATRDEVVDAGKKLQRLFRENRRVADLSGNAG